jgi:DNA-binding phage protein
MSDALEEEIRDYIMPKMKGIYTRLNGGTDDMRDEGHKLELIYRTLKRLTEPKEQA